MMNSRWKTFLKEVMERSTLVIFVRQVKEYILNQAERMYWGIERNQVDKLVLARLEFFKCLILFYPYIYITL